MESNEEREGYSAVIEQISSMFGNVLNRDVIFTVVESCEGDLNQSVEAIMNITSDISKENQSQHTHKNKMSPIPEVSYASAYKNTGAFPKIYPTASPNITNIWTKQLKEILSWHNQGVRIFILMRGVPGSGKSYLARKIVEMTIGSTTTNYQTHIYSTDDFFMVHGQYKFEKYMLNEAHMWNQNRVSTVARQGLSPIIVDNTNIELWEMEPYAKVAVKYGYFLEVVEPNTPWAKKVNQLAKRTVHAVPITTIKRMIENYQDGITGVYLKQTLGLSYRAHMIPPVLRSAPPITHENLAKKLDIAKKDKDPKIDLPSSSVSIAVSEKESETNAGKTKLNENTLSNNTDNSQNKISEEKTNSEKFPQGMNPEELQIYETFVEAQKQIEEMVKFEQAWENCENWDEISQVPATTTGEKVLHPKPPRNTQNRERQESNFFTESVNECNDWSKLAMFMPQWHDDTQPKENKHSPLPPQNISTYTCMELGDTDIDNNRHNLKIISATPRDINEYYISSTEEKIPQKRMFDKSSMTNEHLVTEAIRCKNEEKHFIAFRKLFKNVARADLRDVFDKCRGDVNWAVDIVLDSISNKTVDTTDAEDLSDTEELAAGEQCDCLAAYNIIPDRNQETSAQTKPEINLCEKTCTVTASQKKTKKENPSDCHLQLKRQIEQNVVISDDHYSQHCLKVRRVRRGEYCNDENNADQPSTSGLSQNNQTQNDSTTANQSDDEETNSSVSSEELEKIVSINVGMDFITSLDNLFGRSDMEYPSNIVPKISLPLSILNEINALWMESLMFQLEQSAKQMDDMVKQDEEFARQLAIKEAELLMEGKEPGVPDFKEIMDLDFALSLYHKDIAEWRNKEPMDWAAKLTRDKLYNLFPDVLPEILSELLMAHDNNFQATVEVLLVSTGKTDILEAENGLNKFVMEKEIQRQQKILEEKRKALDEVEWPLLPKGEVVQMSTVNSYREDAEKHLFYRNYYYNKAQDCTSRGMTPVANYYSDVAAFHKLKYEQSNSMAAATLIQVHALNSPDNATIDLHFMRVVEARESLDLFLDTHIQKLRENIVKGGPRSNTLFFITGRGLHSPAGPRVKPAVKKRLKERGLAFSIRNPGLLTAKVTADDKLTYQVKVP